MIRTSLFAALLVAVGLTTPALTSPAQAADAINALIITGGCCHDYEGQTKVLKDFLGKSADVKWTVMNEGGEGKDHIHEVFKKKNWAKAYDVVIYNQCFAFVTDENAGKLVADAHAKSGAGAVVLHCAMHTFRELKSDDYRNLLGVSSRKHSKKLPVKVHIQKKNHPIMKGIKPWTSANEELYLIEKLVPNTTVLATGTVQQEGVGEEPLFWTSTLGKSRTFGTTLGHFNYTLEDERFQEVVARGFLWSAKKLGKGAKSAAE
jgi:type 1 glutamine amidotransferase